MALSADSRLGTYEIIGAIGAGGMGEVYRARDTRLHRDVAVNVTSAALFPISRSNRVMLNWKPNR